MSLISEYIDKQEPKVRGICLELHNLIINELDEVEETIKYAMPTYVYRKQNLIHFAVQKHHIGLYPTPGAITAFAERLKSYKTSKGPIQLPKDSLPHDLITDIVRFRKQEITDI